MRRACCSNRAWNAALLRSKISYMRSCWIRSHHLQGRFSRVLPMRSVRTGGRLRTAALLVLLLSAAVGLAFGVNAVVRPGCSLLPVTLSDTEFVAQPATLEQACAVLGRPLPRPGVLPDGARMAGIAIDGPPPAGMACCRSVNVGYSKNGRNFALLKIHRQDAIPVGNAGDVNATLAGVPAVIRQTRPPTLDADDVSYLWAREGLLYSLHVLLTYGVTRETADAMAASIR
jgi:hypothetical protein